MLKEGAESIFGADDGVDAAEEVEGPGDVEGGVVPEDGPFAGGVVEIGGFVEDFGGIGEDEETVRETFGDPEKLKGIGGGGGLS